MVRPWIGLKGALRRLAWTNMSEIVNKAKKLEENAETGWGKVKKICNSQGGGAVQMLFFCILIKT